MGGGMVALTIWCRSAVVSVRTRVREVLRRNLRKLIEIALTDLDLMARLDGLMSSVSFERENLKDAVSFKDRLQLHRWVAGLAAADGLFLEFGTYKGDSINQFAELKPNVTWHAFDSFVGLPEAWTLGARAGAFSVGGKLPAVRSNVKLIKGFFDATLPAFVRDHAGVQAALVHIDCDLYSSTKTVLEALKGNLGPGSIIVFDELINYPGWQDGEYKAFMEYVAAHGVTFEYLGYSRTGSQVAVRLISTREVSHSLVPDAAAETVTAR